jgi:hypothetical protein
MINITQFFFFSAFSLFSALALSAFICLVPLNFTINVESFYLFDVALPINATGRAVKNP